MQQEKVLPLTGIAATALCTSIWSLAGWHLLVNWNLIEPSSWNSLRWILFCGWTNASIGSAVYWRTSRYNSGDPGKMLWMFGSLVFWASLLSFVGATWLDALEHEWSAIAGFWGAVWGAGLGMLLGLIVGRALSLHETQMSAYLKRVLSGATTGTLVGGLSGAVGLLVWCCSTDEGLFLFALLMLAVGPILVIAGSMTGSAIAVALHWAVKWLSYKVTCPESCTEEV